MSPDPESPAPNLESSLGGIYIASTHSSFGIGDRVLADLFLLYPMGMMPFSKTDFRNDGEVTW